MVDDEDYEYLSQFKWYAHRSHHRIYARRNLTTSSGQRNIKMHQVIMGTTALQEVDHEDGNGLNNQRYNLRIATHRQNAQNSRRPQNNTSGYKGVSWRKDTQNWGAIISLPDGKRRRLGSFMTALEAAYAYDAAAREYFGEFARCNFA